MPDEPSDLSWLPGLDLDFIHRVYRTTLIVALLAGALVWERFGLAALLGWLLGVALSLGILRSAELSVRTFLKPDQQSVRPMVASSLGKTAVVFVLILLAFLGAERGWINLIALAAGFPLPGLILALKLIGHMAVEASKADTRVR